MNRPILFYRLRNLFHFHKCNQQVI